MTGKDETSPSRPPKVAPDEANRGVPAQETEGAVVGSGAGAGGGGNPEDYDSDPQAGGGRLPTHNPKPGSGAEAPSHGGR